MSLNVTGWTSLGSARCSGHITGARPVKAKPSFTCRGADVGSDHCLFLIKYWLWLKRQQVQQKCPRPFAVERFKNRTTAEQFKIELGNRCETPAEDEDVERKWARIKETVTECAEAITRQRQGTYGSRNRPGIWSMKEEPPQAEVWPSTNGRWMAKHDSDLQQAGP